MNVDKNLVAGLKMNNRQMVIASILTMVGAEDDQINEAKSASRVTGALIDRLFKPYLDEDEGKETPEPQEEPESEATPQETVCGSLETKSFPDICEHLEAGHGKKAFKLCKKAKKAGTRGSVLTGLTRKAKEMKDA